VHEPSSQHVCQFATVKSAFDTDRTGAARTRNDSCSRSQPSNGITSRTRDTSSSSPHSPRKLSERARRYRSTVHCIRPCVRSRLAEQNPCSVKRNRERKKGNAGGADLDEAAAASRKERPRRQKPPPRTASSLPNHSSREMVPQSSLDTSLERRAREVRCFTLETDFNNATQTQKCIRHSIFWMKNTLQRRYKNAYSLSNDANH